MHSTEILHWLRETDPAALAQLYAEANRVRRASVGDQVHLRGLVEISNVCARQCAYCGLRAANQNLIRYKMPAQEVVQSAQAAAALGYGTVVLQAGESPSLTAEWVANVVRAIKRETPLAVTLSLGERAIEDYAVWRKAGADRYLLRFETSDAELFRRIHPPRQAGRCGTGFSLSGTLDAQTPEVRTWALPSDRLKPVPHALNERVALLGALRELGYEIGGGVMVGIPGQSYASLARDIELFRELDLDMIGIGPYLPHPDTPLGQDCGKPPADQAPNTEEMVYKMLALTRIVCPEANIPSTTALATINTRNGRELGLQRGANVVMPNLTPARYRRHYEIYPNKACIGETPSECGGCLRRRIAAIGRVPGSGPGGRRKEVIHG